VASLLQEWVTWNLRSTGKLVSSSAQHGDDKVLGCGGGDEENLDNRSSRLLFTGERGHAGLHP
jgi:hypothetical protein